MQEIKGDKPLTSFPGLFPALPPSREKPWERGWISPLQPGSPDQNLAKKSYKGLLCWALYFLCYN